jgi:phospholipase C
VIASSLFVAASLESTNAATPALNAPPVRAPGKIQHFIIVVQENRSFHQYSARSPEPTASRCGPTARPRFL